MNYFTITIKSALQNNHFLRLQEYATFYWDDFHSSCTPKRSRQIPSGTPNNSDIQLAKVLDKFINTKA